MGAAPDVVVVGCGAQGLSTALHLARRGVRVVAVDRAAPGSQTSARAAGQSVLAQTEPACGELMRRTVDKLVRFDDAYGVPLDVHRVGSVKLALSDWAAVQLVREVERATAIGARMQMVDVADAGLLAPHIDASGALAAWHSPDDCYWQPREMVAALHVAAQRAGVDFRIGVDVQAINVSDGRATGIETSTGPLPAGAVVVTAGAWASRSSSAPVSARCPSPSCATSTRSGPACRASTRGCRRCGSSTMPCTRGPTART